MRPSARCCRRSSDRASTTASAAESGGPAPALLPLRQCPRSRRAACGAGGRRHRSRPVHRRAVAAPGGGCALPPAREGHPRQPRHRRRHAGAGVAPHRGAGRRLRGAVRGPAGRQRLQAAKAEQPPCAPACSTATASAFCRSWTCRPPAPSGSGKSCRRAEPAWRDVHARRALRPPIGCRLPRRRRRCLRRDEGGGRSVRGLDRPSPAAQHTRLPG